MSNLPLTTPLRTPQPAPSHLLFQIGSGTVATLGCEVQPVISIGRSDDATGYKPVIDLQPYQATEKGVSRQHLEVLEMDGDIYVRDLGARNGTKMNGVPMTKNQRYPLFDGDVFLLGNLQVIIWFVES